MAKSNLSKNQFYEVNSSHRDKQEFKKPSRKEIVVAAKAWAQFLYGEYQIDKSLHKSTTSNTIENATYHDKLNTQ